MTKRNAEKDLNSAIKSQFSSGEQVVVITNQTVNSADTYCAQIATLLLRIARIEFPVFRETTVRDLQGVAAKRVFLSDGFLLGEVEDSQSEQVIMANAYDIAALNTVIERLDALHVHYSSADTQAAFYNDAHRFGLQVAKGSQIPLAEAGMSYIVHHVYFERFFRGSGETLSAHAVPYLDQGAQALQEFVTCLDEVKALFAALHAHTVTAAVSHDDDEPNSNFSPQFS